MAPPSICLTTWRGRHDHPCCCFGGLGSRSFSWAHSIWFPLESSCLSVFKVLHLIPSQGWDPQPKLHGFILQLAFEGSNGRIEKTFAACSSPSSGLLRLSTESCSLLRFWLDTCQVLRVVLQPSLQLFEKHYYLPISKFLKRDARSKPSLFLSNMLHQSPFYMKIEIGHQNYLVYLQIA